MQGKRHKIYIDENLAPQLARAMNVIQEHLNTEEKKAIEVHSLKDAFTQGIKDEDWIPLVGQQEGVVITQDRHIQSSRHQRELYMSNGVGIIFLKCPKGGMTFWQMFVNIVNDWNKIKQIVRCNKTPFAFRKPGKNKNFEEWTIED